MPPSLFMPGAYPGSAGPGGAAGAAADKASESQRELERKVAELEKRLHEEHEKVLMSNLKSQEEANYSAKVETAIKDVQEKLRRDRRDAEVEETRLKLEAKIQELEQRLVQERETWVSTLKGQTRTREVQDKEIESHFTLRLQEMERRWLEEKAHWQRVVLSKDEEIRNFRSLAEKLKGVEVEYQKALHEKKLLEERASALANEVARVETRLRVVEEKEKENFQLKAELGFAREEVRLHQERMSRELEHAQSLAKEREARLSMDNERLQRELQTVAERVRHEADLEIQKHRAKANMAMSSLMKLRAVAGALERQAAAFKMQAEEGAKAKAELENAEERHCREMAAMQQKWQERELEHRQSLEQENQRRLEEYMKEFRIKMEDEAQACAHKKMLDEQQKTEAAFADRERRIREEMEQQAILRMQLREKNLREQISALKAKIEEREAPVPPAPPMPPAAPREGV